jgi:D-threo-aldose 1-dehydrogenase
MFGLPGIPQTGAPDPLKQQQNSMQFQLPKVVLGTSSLGNLFQVLDDATKTAIVSEFICHSGKPAFFDSAGKYGAGLALESLGKALNSLSVPSQDVIISNKLGWVRKPLTTPEPTFEPGVWKGLAYDAEQKISYDGILECFEEGNQLLTGYDARFVSVHDPDEYLAKAATATEEAHRYQDILEAYRALHELKKAGKADAIGVGAKDWRSIQRIAQDVDLDWVMIANSYTVHSHPAELKQFMQQLSDKGVAIINSAVFNGGFLTGGDFYNYKPVVQGTPEGDALLQWRERFYALCREYNIQPAAAGVQFGLHAPGVQSIALSTTRPHKVKENIDLVVETRIPDAFWNDLFHSPHPTSSSQ